MPEIDLAVDATYYASFDDILAETLPIEDGCFPILERPGLAGPDDEDAIETYRTDQ